MLTLAYGKNTYKLYSEFTATHYNEQYSHYT